MTASPSALRASVTVRGAVQGVGFRPFVYQLATRLNLRGWVLNSAQGVSIEVEGPESEVRRFLGLLEEEKPPHAIIRSVEFSLLDPVGFQNFEIRFSDHEGEKTVFVSPDLATCPECVREIFDSGNRRYHYPFTNCTHCGPRFTIIEDLPYDRANTSMKQFTMCAQCDAEYRDPNNRRFHAQPNACPQCGPQLALWDANGKIVAERAQALTLAVESVRAGKILALKALGGFQIVLDASHVAGIQRLRESKCRDEKPFALMYPSLEEVRNDCEVSEIETRLLKSAQAPIVLLQRSKNSRIPSEVAPRQNILGVMLPNTPLHHLFLLDLQRPIVATSANRRDEPVCINEFEALERLAGMVDYFLVHDRPIVRYVDDSVARVVCGREMVLRRARGYAPLPVRLKKSGPTILALGAHLKNTVALAVGNEAFVSQHIGDLETKQAYSAFQKIADDLPRFYGVKPEIIACDLHPDYLSTQFAVELSPKAHRVQHHWAHIASCLAENEIEPPALGVAWDGAGYGPDGAIWGGEFLLAEGAGFRRVAHLRQFRLAGGDAAARQPRRCALGLLFEMNGPSALRESNCFSPAELKLFGQMLATGFNAPLTSSAGRLFDAIASLLGVRQQVSFEGQAAMELEQAIEPGVSGVYPFTVQTGSPAIVDWAPMVSEILNDIKKGERTGTISAKFHHTLAEMVVEMARQAGQPKVALSGGCFQNKYLVERCVGRLREEGFRPYWHQLAPPNDGGISLGQIAATAWSLEHAQL